MGKGIDCAVLTSGTAPYANVPREIWGGMGGAHFQPQCNVHFSLKIVRTMDVVFKRVHVVLCWHFGSTVGDRVRCALELART